MNGLIYYISAGILWAGFAAQVPGLWHDWRDPLKRALCAVIFLAGFCFALGAPPTVGFLNGAIGVPNAAACVTYAALNAFSAASLVLIVHWRGADSPDHVRRISHGWLITYAVVIAGQVALFAAGDAPVERRTDFDTYYADTPFVREMIVLYLLAHLAAASTTTILCWRWTLQISGWTRRALAVLALGWLCTSAYGVVKLIAVAGRWGGQQWDPLSTRLAPMLVTVGAALTSAGYILPLLGPRIDSLVAFLRLGPLFRLVGSRSGKRHTVLSWRSLGNVELRLTHRTTAIRDGLRDVSVHFDEGVRERAYRQALSVGSSTAEAQAIGDAAMVAVAALSDPRRRAPRLDPAVLDSVALDAIAGFTGPVVGAQTLDTGQPSLIRMSRAVRAAIVEGAVRAERAHSRQA
ncbi:MAB_1171c family putative transporter [Streptomyces capitiformicae]|uniref:MAB_1171c family putative transporter n=1 Tax=Streptomyces capitiformicae TaxID=2014920 RepID=UPI001E336913|nr:MAB_1171c family putative transporter [Streptomyces capitiformicae]